MKGATRIAVLFFLLTSWSGLARAAEEDVEELKSTVREQQRVIDEQDTRIRNLEQRVDSIDQDEGESVVTAPGPTPSAEPMPVVTGGNPKIRLSISGQVHRAMNVLDDGNDTEALHVDSDTSNTRTRFVATGVINDDLTVVARTEIALSANNSNRVDQDNQSAGDRFENRLGEVYIKSKTYGQLSIGRGWSASDSTAEVDLSMTGVVANSNWSDLVGAVKFYDSDSNTLSGVDVDAGFSNMDGLGRENRVTYQTPDYNGFNLSAGANTNDRYDAAVRWAGRGYGLRVAGAFGYVIFVDGGEDRDYRLSGSFSVLHESTGLSFTTSAATEDRNTKFSSAPGGQGDPVRIFYKLGWIEKFGSWGPTAFSGDYSRSWNMPTGSDDGHAAGGTVVQHFEGWGTEVYLQYRWISLDRDGASFDDLNVGSVGVRVKF